MWIISLELSMVQENRAKLPTNARKELLAVMPVGFFFICFQTQAVEFGMDKPYQGDNFTGYINLLSP